MYKRKTGNVTQIVDIDRIVQMAWEDRTPFEAIGVQFGMSNDDVVKLMRSTLSRKSFQRWRARTKGRSTKHRSKNGLNCERFKSALQRHITHNRISKR